MAFELRCPKCNSEAVMEPGYLKGRPVGGGLKLECVRCHYEGPNNEFAIAGLSDSETPHLTGDSDAKS